MKVMAGVLLLLVVCGCRKAPSVADRGAKPASPAGQAASGPVEQEPGFDVAVKLSPKAKAELVVKGETVVVSVSFEGGPKPGTPKKYVGDDGQVMDLGGREVEVAVGTAGAVTARFSKLQANKDALAWVQGTPGVLINVYSGRKASKDNVLDCGIYEGPLSTIADSVVPIDCKLIAE